MSMADPKAHGGRRRSYSDEDFALFAAYIAKRQPYRPVECEGGDECWVDKGPPAYCMKNSRGYCLGCLGKVKA